MTALERIARLFPELAGDLEGHGLREIRLRAGRPVQLSGGGGRRFAGGPLSQERLTRALSALMDHSVHAWEPELARGYFTLEDGSRVGLCGAAGADGRLTGVEGVGAACVRIARAVPGCAEGLMTYLAGPDGLRSALLVSPPGMGKTTCLRDAARLLATAGRCVAVADERHEIAACRRGVPTLDVGPSTDVMDGGAKAAAIPAILRTMAPEVIVADEIGSPGDAEALGDARRCGVAVVASAHGSDLSALERRAGAGDAVAAGAFDWLLLLGGEPGRLIEARRWTNGEARLCGCA